MPNDWFEVDRPQTPPQDRVEPAPRPEGVPDNPVRKYIRLTAGESLLIETDFGIVLFQTERPGCVVPSEDERP